MVLFTLPYFAPPEEAPDGSIYPENQPARVVAFNRDLARVAAADRGAVTLVDLNALLVPARPVPDGGGRRGGPVARRDPRHPGRRAVAAAPRSCPTVAELGLAARTGVTR